MDGLGHIFLLLYNRQRQHANRCAGWKESWDQLKVEFIERICNQIPLTFQDNRKSERLFGEQVKVYDLRWQMGSSIRWAPFCATSRCRERDAWQTNREVPVSAWQANWLLDEYCPKDVINDSLRWWYTLQSERLSQRNLLHFWGRHPAQWRSLWWTWNGRNLAAR